MQRLLYIAIISLISTGPVQSQDIHQVKEFADRQLEKGNYPAALKEYQRVLLFDEKQEYPEVYGRIADLFYQHEAFDNALVYYDFARKATREDSLKLEMTFRKVLCYFRQSEFYMGLAELLDLPDEMTPWFDHKRELYLAVCYYGLDDFRESEVHFSHLVDSVHSLDISSEFETLERISRKYDPDRLERMSLFLPGLGQAVAGAPGAALNSVFLLSGILVYSYYTAFAYGFVDGALVLVTWFYRYYTGGHRKAYQLGTERIQDQKRISYLRIMEITGEGVLPGGPLPGSRSLSGE